MASTEPILNASKSLFRFQCPSAHCFLMTVSSVNETEPLLVLVAPLLLFDEGLVSSLASEPSMLPSRHSRPCFSRNLLTLSLSLLSFGRRCSKLIFPWQSSSSVLSPLFFKIVCKARAVICEAFPESTKWMSSRSKKAGSIAPPKKCPINVPTNLDALGLSMSTSSIVDNTEINPVSKSWLLRVPSVNKYSNSFKSSCLSLSFLSKAN
mmetsp:Transcript_25422/g.35650  ORF Transcript_25422/g.35650 Transcript_25422/m.35650 type:complete len:208 (-) Transcript_25422:1770-2393(-)